MILVGSQRSGAKALAQHLLKEENEHVEVHELRGFASDDLTGALQEAQAISKGTRCKQYLYSLSLNPPLGESVPTKTFEDAIQRAEDRLGLTDQPRAIVFHEKQGRRHCHVVWSRIDADEMKAVPLPFTKQKLQELARELYIEHGWTMPRGLMQSSERDVRNFSLAEWQQAKRVDRDPRDIKTALQDCWAVSDTKQSLAAALEERGFKLAHGDRRAVVAVDAQGEVYALARWVGVKTKDVREKLGDCQDLPSVAQSKEELAGKLAARLQELKHQQNEQHAQELREAKEEAAARIKEHRDARQRITEAQAARWEQETKERQDRFNQGLRGWLDRLTGRHHSIKARNETETLISYQRDRAEKDALIFAQLEERREQQERLVQLVQQHAAQQQELSGDITRIDAVAQEGRRAMLDDLRQRRGERERPERAPQEGPVAQDDRLDQLHALRQRRMDEDAPSMSGPQLEQ